MSLFGTVLLDNLLLPYSAKTNLALSAKLQCRSENKKAIAKIGVSMDSFVGMNRRYTINTQYSRLHVML